MPLSTLYRSISLDTIANFATYQIGESPRDQSPKLRGNESHRLLTLIFGRWFMASPYDIFKRGNPFHARTRASHKALGATLKLGREWVCELTGRLVEAGWITTHAPRRPDGKQEVTIYKPGWRFKELLVTLLKSKQHSRVVDQQQKLPSKEEVEKNLQFLRGLQQELGEKLSLKKAKRW